GVRAVGRDRRARRPDRGALGATRKPGPPGRHRGRPSARRPRARAGPELPAVVPSRTRDLDAGGGAERRRARARRRADRDWAVWPERGRSAPRGVYAVVQLAPDDDPAGEDRLRRLTGGEDEARSRACDAAEVRPRCGREEGTALARDRCRGEAGGGHGALQQRQPPREALDVELTHPLLAEARSGLHST